MAVKRVEEELSVRIFDRTGPAVSLTTDGHRVVRGFDRVLEIIAEMKGQRAEMHTVRVGVSPLISGRDVAKMLGQAFRSKPAGFAIEFLNSSEIVARSDFDIKIVAPGLKRRSTINMDFSTIWIGADNGVFIRSLQEAEVWDRAKHVLIDHGIQVSKVIEVNDCGYAYHLASSGAGFTPCVMTRDNAFRGFALPHLPPLPNMRLDIFADPDVAASLKISLSSPAEGAEAAPAMRAVAS